MSAKNLLIYVSFGTYGRDDDAFGAILAANSALSKDIDVAMILVENGVCMAKKGQIPGPIGFPNNLDELQDFLDLDGRLIVSRAALEQRGIAEGEMIDGVEIVDNRELSEIISQYSLTLTF